MDIPEANCLYCFRYRIFPRPYYRRYYRPQGRVGLCLWLVTVVFFFLLSFFCCFGSESRDRWGREIISGNWYIYIDMCLFCRILTWGIKKRIYSFLCRQRVVGLSQVINGLPDRTFHNFRASWVDFSALRETCQSTDFEAQDLWNLGQVCRYSDGI